MKPVQMTVAVDANAVIEAIRKPIMDALPSLVEEAVVRAVEKVRPPTTASDETPAGCSESAASGVTLTQADKTNASELRTAYLLGKLPENGSLLINTKEVARLLNISPRSVYRLTDEKAVPEPIRIGNKVQWRVREIIEWVESDCPPQKFWRYSEARGKGDWRR